MFVDIELEFNLMTWLVHLNQLSTSLAQLGLDSTPQYYVFKQAKPMKQSKNNIITILELSTNFR